MLGGVAALGPLPVMRMRCIGMVLLLVLFTFLTLLLLLLLLVLTVVCTGAGLDCVICVPGPLNCLLG